MWRFESSLRHKSNIKDVVIRDRVSLILLFSMQTKQHIIVVCGPTATGKSNFAVTLAKELIGEIISSDSRQVYQGLDIGSGKITKREMKGVPHHLLDVASPKRVFSVTRYQKLATKAIDDIVKRGNIPIICGGTGFYIDAVLYEHHLPQVKPNAQLRKQLEKIPTEELIQKLQFLDHDRFASIDLKNRVRLIRAIEIATTLGSVPKTTRIKKYDIDWHYLDFPDTVLKERIHTRLLTRMKSGMIAEVKKLHEEGVSWKRLEALGLEYRYIALYLQEKITKATMLTELESSIWHYAKRQRTWFKKYAK